MSEGSTYHQIVRSSSIIGGASLFNIVIGLVRTKVAAVLLGPAGIGLIGLFGNIVAAASTVAGLGFSKVGTRQIAEASATGDGQSIGTARRALFWGTLCLGGLGAASFWVLRDVVARWVLDDSASSGEIGWLALAIALTIGASSQGALLRGLRRIGDVARISVWSAVLSTMIGIAALLKWGLAGVVVYVSAAPLAAFLLGHLYVARLPKLTGNRPGFAALNREWRRLAGLGFAFMIAGLASTAGQLGVRTLLQHQMGVEALGHFQASWAISMTYIGFVLGAMGADYYPRLTAVIHDHAATNRMVNEQTEVALMLATPVLLAMLGLAPWIIDLLYTDAFGEAADILRWQVLGDVLKVASWPLGFILLAAGAGRTYVVTEWATASCFVGFSVLLLPLLGAEAVGVAFLGMYAACLIMVLVLARWRTGFRWSLSVVRLLIAAFGAGVSVLALGEIQPIAGAVTGMLTSLGFAAHALTKLADAGPAAGSLGRRIEPLRRFLTSLGIRRE